MKLTEDQLQRYVDQRYVERGQKIFENGAVVLGELSDREVAAVCCGSRIYKINLTINRGKLGGTCTCPAFEDFGPCKHIAATALAVMASNKGQYLASVYATERVDEHHSVRQRLLSMGKTELVELVLQFAGEEEVLWLLDEE